MISREERQQKEETTFLSACMHTPATKRSKQLKSSHKNNNNNNNNNNGIMVHAASPRNNNNNNNNMNHHQKKSHNSNHGTILPITTTRTTTSLLRLSADALTTTRQGPRFVWLALLGFLFLLHVVYNEWRYNALILNNNIKTQQQQQQQGRQLQQQQQQSQPATSYRAGVVDSEQDATASAAGAAAWLLSTTVETRQEQEEQQSPTDKRDPQQHHQRKAIEQGTAANAVASAAAAIAAAAAAAAAAPSSSHLQLEQQPQEQPPSQQEVNLLYGMHGASPAFLAEWKISLKSVLYHAPLDAPLHLHILCNDVACRAVQHILTHDLQLINTTKWRHPIRITAYNVTQYESAWSEFLVAHTARSNTSIPNVERKRVTFGAWYRLFAHRVIPHATTTTTTTTAAAASTNDNEYNENGDSLHDRRRRIVTYLDNEVVITTNLNALFQELPENQEQQQSQPPQQPHIFQVGPRRCTGFMNINLPEMSRYWELVQRLEKMPADVKDQALTKAVDNEFRQGRLSSKWDAHLAEMNPRPWRLRNETTTTTTTYKGGPGMMHFNGVRANYHTFWALGMANYCNQKPECNASQPLRQAWDESWGLADYYVRLPWDWVKSMGADKIPPGQQGHAIQFKLFVPPLLL